MMNERFGMFQSLTLFLLAGWVSTAVGGLSGLTVRVYDCVASGSTPLAARTVSTVAPPTSR